MKAMMNELPKVIVFSPVRVTPGILRETLCDLRNLRREAVSIDFWFYDDNDNVDSSVLLNIFCSEHPLNSRILPKLSLPEVPYMISEETHNWDTQLVDRIIAIKNLAFSEFLKTEAKAIFMLDADTSLHPETMEHLYGLNLPIVAVVHWTKYTSGDPYLPNAWDYQAYDHFSPESIMRLRSAGLYRVGGVGGCTFYRREAIERGVSFSRIENLNLWGEDKHLAVRSVCLGFKLYIDTTYPAFHIFRDSLIPQLHEWRARGYDRTFFDEWLNSEWERAIYKRFQRPEQDPLLKRIRIAVWKIREVIKNI
jgi:hypothetical protein